MPKRLIILGSTGSIGTQTLQVVRDFPGEFEVVALSANTQTDILAGQVKEFSPRAICVSNGLSEKEKVRELARRCGVDLYLGQEGLTQLVEKYEADMVVVATVGIAGLVPTLRAIELGRTIALANKEVLVTAGELVMSEARRRGVAVLPIDSEHNAIFQCLSAGPREAVRRLILTASGGPFRGVTREKLRNVTPEDVMNHPTWKMGRRITIDCATLLNKGFEVIEAHHLFDIPLERIEVVVHPQSIVHSMVEFVDGSVIAQLAITDMYLPIQNVLFYPRRVANNLPRLDLVSLGSLTFEAPDLETFPCLAYAYEAARKGGTFPAVLNAADEGAISRFLKGKIGFADIPVVIRHVLDQHKGQPVRSVDDIREASLGAHRIASHWDAL
jgi:1-deoxy-D-xylulose-5-phosphate reductoisomerase